MKKYKVKKIQYRGLTPLESASLLLPECITVKSKKRLLKSQIKEKAAKFLNENYHMKLGRCLIKEMFDDEEGYDPKEDGIYEMTPEDQADFDIFFNNQTEEELLKDPRYAALARKAEKALRDQAKYDTKKIYKNRYQKYLDDPTLPKQLKSDIAKFVKGKYQFDLNDDDDELYDSYGEYDGLYNKNLSDEDYNDKDITDRSRDFDFDSDDFDEFDIIGHTERYKPEKLKFKGQLRNDPYNNL